MGVLWGLFVTILYMVVAWRAMRAHELISRVLMRDLQLKYDGATPASDAGPEQPHLEP
jgi:hypothetical protein